MPQSTHELPAADTRHGKTAGYVAGCRCLACKQANKDYRVAQKARGLPDPADSRHGTVGGFTNYHCRCDPCRDAMREWDNTRRRPSRKEDVRESHRKWYARNREKRNAQIRQHRANNIERDLERGAEYRAANKAAIRAYFASPQGRAAKNRAEARRRAAKKGAPIGDLREATEYRQLIAGDPCSYCGAPAEQADHIVPLSKGGPEAWDNLTPACASCNGRKNARDLLTFLAVRRDAAA